VLYPFVPPSTIDDGVIDRLSAVFAAAAPFDCTFDRCRWFAHDLLWLAPHADEEFRALTADVMAEFPGYPPYGGQFQEVVPHLTIGDSSMATADELEAVEADVSRRLPVTAFIGHAELLAGSDEPNSWRTVATMPLGATS
jgi:2'-5' RNA ligase